MLSSSIVSQESQVHILFQSLCYNFKDSWHEVVFVKMYLFALKSKEVQHLQAARNHRLIIQGTFELYCQSHQKPVHWTAPIQCIFVVIYKLYSGIARLFIPLNLKLT